MIISAITYQSGLQVQIFNQYHNESVSFFSTASLLYTGATSDLTNITTVTNSYSLPNGAQYFSTMHYGLFLANATGTWTFYINSDDGSYVWIGSTADYGYTISNATINDGNAHGAILVSATYSMVSGTYYPIRIIYGQGGGGYALDFSFTSPSSGTRIYNGAGYYYNITSTNTSPRMYPSAFIPQASWLASTPTSSTHSTFTYTISGQAYGNGQYICSADVDSGYQSYNERWLFDGKYPDLTPQSTSQLRSYNNTNIVLQLPTAIKLSSYFICGSTCDIRWASSWTLYGSNDGTTYTSLDTQSGQAYQITGVIYTTSQSTAYSYYKFVPGALTNLKQWLLYGI